MEVTRDVVCSLNSSLNWNHISLYYMRLQRSLSLSWTSFITGDGRQAATTRAISPLAAWLILSVLTWWRSWQARFWSEKPISCWPTWSWRLSTARYYRSDAKRTGGHFSILPWHVLLNELALTESASEYFIFLAHEALGTMLADCLRLIAGEPNMALCRATRRRQDSMDIRGGIYQSFFDCFLEVGCHNAPISATLWGTTCICQQFMSLQVIRAHSGR